MRKPRDAEVRREKRREAEMRTWRGWKPAMEWIVSFTWKTGDKSFQKAKSYEEAKRVAAWTLANDAKIEHAWVIEPRRPS